MNRYSTLVRFSLAAGVAAAALTGCGMMGSSNTATFTGTLNGASEVPPNMTAGSGTAQATLDKNTNLLKYPITYTAPTGPATAAHFHGPATAGANAGVVVPFASAANPIEGQITITPAQAADLLAGKWYANVHTAANAAGEIRGQMLPR